MTAEPPIALAKRLQAQLEAISCEIMACAHKLPTISEAAATGEGSLVDNVRRTLNVMRRRDAAFPPGLFAEPAWNIILDLFLAEVDGRHISISSACIASAGPSTTALRYIQALEQAGMVTRLSDPTDGRRVFVTITPAAQTAIERAYCGSNSGAGQKAADAAAG